MISLWIKSFFYSSWVFWLFAVIFSIYFGVRGTKVNFDTEKEALKNNKEAKPNPWWMVAPYAFWFNFICSFVGWASLRYVYKLLYTKTDISTGSSAVIIFLLLLALPGITGHLAQIVLSIKLGNK